jgi:Flp pilus assembly protein TadG
MRHPARTERGAAAIELALLLPILLLVIGGIVDWGRFMYTEVTLTNGAREGARAGLASGATAANMTTRARAAMPASWTSTTTITPTACAGAGTNASLTATQNFRWVLLRPAMSLFGGGGLLPTQAKSTATMRCY